MISCYHFIYYNLINFIIVLDQCEFKNDFCLKTKNNMKTNKKVELLGTSSYQHMF